MENTPSEKSRAAPDESAAERLIIEIMAELKEKFPDTPEDTIREAAADAVNQKLAELPRQKILNYGKTGGHPRNSQEAVDYATNRIFGDRPIKNGEKITLHRDKRRGVVTLRTNTEGLTYKNLNGVETILSSGLLGTKERNYAAAMISLAQHGTREFTFKQLLTELNPAFIDKKHISKKEYDEILETCYRLQMPIWLERQAPERKTTKGDFIGALVSLSLSGVYAGEAFGDRETNGLITVWEKSPLIEYAAEVQEVLTYSKDLLIWAGQNGLIHEARFLLRRLNIIHQSKRKAKGKPYQNSILWEKLKKINKPSNATRFRDKICMLLNEWIRTRAELNGEQLLYNYNLIRKSGRIYSIELIIDEPQKVE